MWISGHLDLWSQSVYHAHYDQVGLGLQEVEMKPSKCKDDGWSRRYLNTRAI
jgi:hypothetical protein